MIKTRINKYSRISLTREMVSYFLEGVYFRYDLHENRVYVYSKKDILKKQREINRIVGNPRMRNKLSRKVSRRIGFDISFSEVDSKGRVSIPRDIVVKANLDIGDELVLFRK